MNKILLISTCKEKLHELEFVKPIEDILSSEKIKFFVKNYKEITEKDLTVCSKVIICGTSLKDFDYLMDYRSFEWIKNFDKPILGICAGSQVLASLFRGRIYERGKKTLDRKEIGFVVCNFEKGFLGFLGNYEVYGLHQVGIGIGSKKSVLEPYGFSNKGLQAFKHREKPFYGVLFHPEVRNKKMILVFIKMDKSLVEEVKQKKEFSKLPDSIIEKSLDISNGNVKDARAFLRKYFGVFLTNKVMKGRDEEVLGSHISSKFRDYSLFYKEIFNGKKVNSIIDLGCGVNGFSYPLLVELLGEINYLGIGASGQVVENTNSFFEEEKFNSARVEHLDLFDLKKVEGLIKTYESPKAILLLQTLDALEGLERNYSKTLLFGLSEFLNKQDFFVISMPLHSISGKKKFEARRTRISNFLEENFLVEKDTELGNERIFIVRKR